MSTNEVNNGFSANAFVMIADLKTPLMGRPIFGRVIKRQRNKIVLLISKCLGFGKTIERSPSSLAPAEWRDVPDNQLKQIGMSWEEIVREFSL